MLIEIILLILAIPIGYLIAWLANDELVAGRKWFIAIICLFSAIGLFYLFSGTYYIALACLFIVIISSVSLIKSKDSKFTKKRI